MTDDKTMREWVQSEPSEEQEHGPGPSKVERAAVAVFSVSALLGLLPGLFGLGWAAFGSVFFPLVGIPLLMLIIFGHYLAFRYWRALRSGERTSAALWLATALYNLAPGLGAVAYLDSELGNVHRRRERA